MLTGLKSLLRNKNPYNVNEFTLICVTKHLCNIVCLKTNTLMDSRSNMALHFKFIFNPKKIYTCDNSN